MRDMVKFHRRRWRKGPRKHEGEEIIEVSSEHTKYNLNTVKSLIPP